MGDPKPTATCPTCGAIWKPTLEERIAAKSDAPPCWVCVWAETPEGHAALDDLRRASDRLGQRLEATGSSRFAGPGSSPTVPTTPDTSDARCVDPTAIVRAAR
jgi:hypothetical protein